jgi:Lrp/AsnC family transcriptional regulator, leucine-responsive regulatory protein
MDRPILTVMTARSTQETSPNSQLDRFDHAMIDILARDGRITVTELASQIGLSKTPTQVRLKRLIDEGYILGFRAIMNAAKLGMDHVAFTEVKLSDTREAALREFNTAVRKIREVEECHMIASSFDYLLKVLGEKISSLPHVASTSTFVAMETIQDFPPG